MSLLFLTSTGFSSEKAKEEFVKDVGSDRSRRVGIITTAANGKEQNKYAQLARTQLEEMGFVSVEYIDVETDPLSRLERCSVVYVCGGNTFYLLFHLKHSGAEKVLRHMLQQEDLIYVGVSAGSIIIGPSIRIAAEIDPDPNEIGLTELKGLGAVDFEILPHYSERLEREVVAYEQAHGVKVERIADGEALVVGGRELKIIK